ncbi:hypothetical protein UVI_02036840 [Ustilaginoidea virens]|nr:hypothetical protein UVI_02036840 [Ustilaginoidea virens]
MVPDEGPRNGLRHLESRLETTATAALVRNSVSSVWSPRPETKQNSIFSIMVQHWGDEKAMTIRRQISDSHVLPRQRKAAQQAVATASSKLSAATESSGDKDLFTLNHEPETNHFGASPPLCPSSDDGWRSWCGNLLDGSDVLGEGLRKPVSEVYYFGEQAIKALGTPAAPKPDSGRKDASGKMCAGMMLDAKVQGSGFWDWGSWF